MEPSEILYAMCASAAERAVRWRKETDALLAGAEPTYVWLDTPVTALRVEAEAADRAVRFAKTALDAGVDERRLQINEQLAAGIGGLLRGIYEGLVQENELSENGRRIFRERSREGLQALEGGPVAGDG